MKAKESKERNEMLTQLQLLYNDFAKKMLFNDDFLLLDSGKRVFKAYHEAWKYKCDKWRKKFKYIRPDYRIFFALVVQNILTVYYGVKVSLDKILENYCIEPNEAAVKCVCA